MSNEYLLKKKFIKPTDIKEINIFFDNGDYVSIEDTLLSFSLKFYDRLIWKDNSIVQVAFGELSLKLSDKKIKSYSQFVFNKKELLQNRKKYVVERCINGCIDHIVIRNENNFPTTIYGDIFAENNEDIFVLKFLPNEKYGPFENNFCSIDLNNVTKTIIRKINLDFENCESYTIYQNEIESIDLIFEKQLFSIGFGDGVRQIKSGFMIIKLDKDRSRDYCFLDDYKFVSNKQLENRICRGQKKEPHDICHLYVTYETFNYKEECLEIPCLGDYEDSDENYSYCGGFAKKLKHGYILIVFGKDAEKRIDKINVEIE